MATTLLELVLMAAMALTAWLGVIRPVIGPAGLAIGVGTVFGGPFPSVEATLDATKVPVPTAPELPALADGGMVRQGDALELTIPTHTTIGVYDPDLRQWIGLVGSGIMVALLAIVVLALLLLLVRTLRHGDPFIPDNARRLYLIAGLVGLGGEAAVLLRAWGEAGVLANNVVAPYVVQGGTPVSPWPLAAGFGIAVVAEVFRRGAALREEVEGLV